MQYPKISSLLLAAAMAGTVSMSHAADGADGAAYPTRALRIIVPYTPGAINDILARQVGAKLAEGLGQPVLVENKPGGNTVIGTDYVAKAAPDGYTLLQMPGAHAINAALLPRLPYDPVKGFSLITLAATSPFVLVSNPAVPARNLPEFLALAKAAPGKYVYGSTGNGGNAHLMGEMLKSMAHVDLLHAPYKGASQALTDLIGGQIQLMFTTYPAVSQHVKSGRVRALAVTSARRWSALPELPTVAESGIGSYEALGWWGYAAPAGTPRAVVMRLNQEINQAVKSTALRTAFQPEGVELRGTTPEEFEAYLTGEINTWTGVIRAANIKPD